MAHELVRIREKLCNTPHLINEQAFESILSYLDQRNQGKVEIRSGRDRDDEEEYQDRYNYNSELQVATMNVEGPTTNKPVTIMGMDCGGFSYETWKEDFVSLAERGVKTVAFLVDSGGGEAYGCFDSARYVREVADEYGITLMTYVDGLAASAAYSIASISDEIIMANQSEVGSIGVLVRLMNDNKKLEKEGYERTFITFGGQKVPFADDGTFRKEFLEDIQYKVDLLGQEFIRFVAENRGLSEEAVRATQARTFIEKDALELGLADKVMTPEEFYGYLADQAQNNEGNMKSNLFKPNQKELSVADHTQELATLQTQNQELSTQLAEFTERFAALEATVNAKDAELAKAAEQMAKMEEDKEAAKASLRKEQLAAVLPEDKVEGMAASLASLEDDAFATVLGNLGAQQQATAESDLFKEMGSDFEAESQDDKEELSSTDKALMERFPHLKNS